MFKKYITLLPAIALFFLVKQASAIGITTIANGFAYSAIYNQSIGNVYDFQPIPVGIDSWGPFSVGIGSSNPFTMSASGLWQFANTPDTAWINGQGYVQNGAVNSTEAGSNSLAELYLSFALSETVNYSFQSSFYGNLGSGATADNSIYLYDITANSLIAVSQLSTTAASAGAFQLPIAEYTGVLNPGIYSAVTYADIRHGDGGFGQFNSSFRFDSLNGSSVPDTGSTAMLLGIAFMAIGYLRHRI